MKKTKILLIGILLLMTCSCSFKKDDLEGATIYTTTYPIEYITKYLYSDYANISSIYPKDANPDNYTFSKKQIKNYSKGDLFIYNGLSAEKDLAKNLVNANKKLLIIDVSYGLNFEYEDCELWINPRNYLVLTKNIKNNLSEYLTSKYIIEQIENKYNEIEENISLIDASLQSLVKNAKDNSKSTIVVSNDSFNYLKNYGFNVISLTDENNLKETKLNTIKNNFKTKKYSYILTAVSDSETELITDLVKNYSATSITINDFDGINEIDYFDYMTKYIDNIKTITS